MVFFSQKTSLLLVPTFSPMFFFAFPKDASPATRHARVAKCGKTNKRIRVVVRVVVVQRRESFFFSRPPPWVFIVAKARVRDVSQKDIRVHLFLSFPSFFSLF
jgi:hypothetical protein